MLQVDDMNRVHRSLSQVDWPLNDVGNRSGDHANAYFHDLRHWLQSRIIHPVCYDARISDAGPDCEIAPDASLSSSLGIVSATQSPPG